ncbi:hypothetical protein V8D89_008977 [Ganoderma adspersum]
MAQRRIAGIAGCDYTESELCVGTQSDWVRKCGRYDNRCGRCGRCGRCKLKSQTRTGRGGVGTGTHQGRWEKVEGEGGGQGGCKDECQGEWEGIARDPERWMGGKQEEGRPSQLQAYRAHKADWCVVHPGDRLIRFLVPVPHIQLTAVLTRCSVSSPNSNTVIVVAHRSPANQTGCRFARKHASQHSRILVVQEYSPFEKFTFRTPIKTNSIKSIDSSSFVRTCTHHIICAVARTTSLSAHRSDGRLVRSQRTQGGASTAEMQSGPSSNAQPAASSAGQSQRLPASSGAQQLNSLHQNVLTLTPRIEQALSTVRDVKDVAPNITNTLDDVSRIGQDTGNANVRLGQIEEWIDDLTDKVAHADNSVVQLTAENKRFAAMDRDLHDILRSRSIALPIEDDERWNGDLSENTEEWNTA